MPVSHNGSAPAWSAGPFGLPGSIPGAGVFQEENLSLVLEFIQGLVSQFIGSPIPGAGV